MKLFENLTILITARSGSKRIKNKNLQKIGGASLIERSLKFAGNFDCKIILSTDYEINDLGLKKNYSNLHYVKRSKYLSQDKTTSDEVIKSVILEQNLKGIVLLLQPTSPFREKASVIEGLKNLISREDIDMIFSVHEFFEDLWEFNENESIIRTFQKERRRQQDRKVRYVENGNFYLFKVDRFTENEFSLANLNSSIIKIDFPYTLDINNNVDLNLANLISKQWNY